VAVVILCLLAVVYSAAPTRIEAMFTRDTGGCRGSGDVPVDENVATTRRATLCLLNRERSQRGLSRLRTEQHLERAAQNHSEDMGERYFYAHESPDGHGPTERLAAAGYAKPTHGENIHWGVEADATPARIVRDWMDSPGHRANVLRPEFSEIGIGVGDRAPEPASGRAAVYTTNFGGPGPYSGG